MAVDDFWCQLGWRFKHSWHYLLSSVSNLLCKIIQETLHLHGGKQYLKNCYIEGNYGFIFEDSTALLEHCHIHCKSAGYIAAHDRKATSEETGFVFFK
uniref:pectinesterase n=1 Tax=Arundo donax TaxID=35708 RepID=A0A0A9DRI0_ARUDO